MHHIYKLVIDNLMTEISITTQPHLVTFINIG